tara:strand:+ start:3193 stop:4284 length:1092 start_codon:yes stop_codon:yes gene_type:complete
MKQEIYKPSFLFFSILIGALIAPFYRFFNLLRPNTLFQVEMVKTILVAEYHRIGDVLMIIPALHALKERFNKDVRIILLCSSSSAPLARDLELANEVITFDAPWTTWSFSPFKWIQARSFARSLRNRHIDLAIDFKGDIRNSWFLWHIKSKHSLGYAATGGNYFFSRTFPFPFQMHQTKRAMNLVSKIEDKCTVLIEPNWVVKKSGYVVLHPGTVDQKRSWPLCHWITLINSLKDDFKLAIVKTKESEDIVYSVQKNKLPIYIFEGDIIQFKNWLKEQRLLIAPDSMAGHLAAYLGIPVISLFGAQNPELTKPLGDKNIIEKPVNECSHQRDHWRLCSACMKTVEPVSVRESVINLVMCNYEK